MAEFKFSCPQCGQHLSGNEHWSGHQIQCPTCATTLTVPQDPSPPAAAAPAPVRSSLVPQPPAAHGSKLSAGPTQVTRPPAPGTIPIRPLAGRPPKPEIPLLKYGIYALVLAALGGAAYLYVPAWLNKLQDGSSSNPTQAAPAANVGGSGPLGEVNGAMDVSDALDAGSSAPPRPAPARKAVGAQRPAAPAVNPAPGATNSTPRARNRLPGLPAPAGGGRP